MVQLYLSEPSALKEAMRSFTVIKDSVHANKNLGVSGQLEIMACDCAFQHTKRRSRTNSHANSLTNSLPTSRSSSRQLSEEDSSSSSDESESGPKELCGADSNCINRMTYMECYGEHCGCPHTTSVKQCRKTGERTFCDNRRFQNYQYAKIDVFHAGAKGYGVRALEHIPEGGFIFEYTGEVLDEPRFVRRQEKYEREGVKHFYFMMLQKEEYIDATEKGSIARFCNHSCNPNAVIEKWVVGPKLRMGLFAKRDIQRGEEICFDYKVDRYGSKAQPCYCGENNCSGFLGGRTQTGGALLPPSVIEGLGLDSDIAFAWPEKARLRLQSEFDLERVLGLLKQKQNKGQLSLAPQSPQGLTSLSRNLSSLSNLSSNLSNQGANQEQSPSQDHKQNPDQSRRQSQEQSQDQGLKQVQRLKQEPKQSPDRNQKLNQAPNQEAELNGKQKAKKNLNQSGSNGTAFSEDQDPNLTGEGNSKETEQDDKKISCAAGEKKKKRSSNKGVDLIALLDAQTTLPDVKRAQQLLLSTLPVSELTPDELPEFMRILMQAKENAWLIKLMLERVTATESTTVHSGILNMHGYEIMGTVLNRWRGFDEVVSQALTVLQNWPKVTRNKISSSKIESIVNEIREQQQAAPEVRSQAADLLEEWSGLSMGYRIPRRKIDSTKPKMVETEEEEKSEKTATVAEEPQKPTVRKSIPLPSGWEKIIEPNGSYWYFQKASNTRSWDHPKDSHGAERGGKRQKELEAEKKRVAEQLKRDRELQQNEIQRIIDEAITGLGSSTAQSADDSTADMPVKLLAKQSFETVFAAYIPKLVFVFEKELGRDRCKRHARDIVHVLAKKEKARGTSIEDYELLKDRKNKIKGFVKEYMTKVAARHNNRPSESPAKRVKK